LFAAASAPSAVTVGATDSADNAASFSNWGSCVDIWAPGVSIYSSVTGSSYASFSGTSMATPHVAGVAARLWSAGVCTSAQTCAEALKCMARPNMVVGLSDAKAASPNLMLYGPPGV
jgi:subtilisin family serine protease